MTEHLQEGVYHAPGQRPGAAFCLLFLRAAALDAAVIQRALTVLWETYQNLKQGLVAELRDPALGDVGVPSGNLTVLIGYGIKAFEIPGVRRPAPEELADFGRFRSPLLQGGGPLLANSGQSYASDVSLNPASEHIAVQFIADSELAVSRAVVETWKVLDPMVDAASQLHPLQIVAFYRGFQRDDHRSWIGFHDGISNLPSDQRHLAITIKPPSNPDDAWTEGGSYLAFLRMAVDLRTWTALDRTQQELLVGRDKLSGCPLAGMDAAGKPIPAAGCPVPGTRQITEPGNEAFRTASPVADAQLNASHVQRVNHHRNDFASRDSLRIFRQGYEFLEPATEAPGFRVGLNFVSFQDTPQRLQRIFQQDGWLGRTNFGGDPANPLPGIDRLLTVRAAGIFLIPPVVDGERFPGETLFQTVDPARMRRATRKKTARTKTATPTTSRRKKTSTSLS